MQEILNNRLIKTEMVEWKKLVPFQPDNLKKTEPHKLQKLANSLCQNGFSMNFYVWEKDGQILIIDGHSRHEVLQLLESGAIYPKNPDGKEYSVTIPEKLPCSFLHLKNKTEAKKAVLIYNSKYKNIDSDILAEWVSDLNLDELKSQIEIPELKLDFDMPQELENDTIDDTAKIKTDIKLGDLIEIGKHRLLCGDSTKKEDVERLMDGAKIDIGFMSPPYNSNNVDFTYDYKAKKTGGFYVSGNDSKSKEEYFNFCISILNNCLLVVNELHSIFWNVMYNANSRDDYGKIIFSEKNPFRVRETIVWNKITGFPVAGDNIISRMTEFIFLLSNSKKYKTNQTNKTIYWNRWDISSQDSQDSQNEHKACYPVDLVNKALIDFSEKDDNVLDLFLGSGTTMVACQTLDRTCYGMELEPLYCQAIINRMRKNFPELDIKVNGKEYKES